MPHRSTLEFTEAAAHAYEAVTRRFEEIFGAAFALVGIRVRSGYTLREFTLAASALSEGCALRDRIDPRSTRGFSRPTGPDGKFEEWTLFSLSVEALIWQFTEPDPDFVMPEIVKFDV